MAKHTKGKTPPPPPRTPKRLYQSILALAVIGSMVAVYFYAGRDSSSGMDAEGMAQSSSTGPTGPTGMSASNPALRNRLILPAYPQRPRPITIPPEQFAEPEIRQAYQAAKDVPEALETVACYCGCYSEASHRNNLDCYKDNHGVT